MKLLKETIVIIAACLLVFTWQHTLLSNYTIQTIGFFVALYLIVSLTKKMSHTKLVFGGIWDVFILIVVLLLLVFATNGLSGGMFFFLYFLLFGVAFVFSPGSIVTLVLGITLVFAQQALNSGDVTSNFVKLGTLWLIAPLAFFLSVQYQKADVLEGEMENMQDRTTMAAKTIRQDAKEVLAEKTLSKDAVKKLNEILEETVDLQAEET